MNRLIRILLASQLLAGTALPAFADDGREPVPAPFPYTGQSRFVTVPAQALASPAVQAGFMAGALLCLPGSLYQEAKKNGEVPMEQQPSLICGHFLGTALGWPVYAAVGLPLLLLEGLFWKGPRALLGMDKTTAAPK